jgi:hypothetical protein
MEKDKGKKGSPIAHDKKIVRNLILSDIFDLII